MRKEKKEKMMSDTEQEMFVHFAIRDAVDVANAIGYAEFLKLFHDAWCMSNHALVDGVFEELET
jgi:hypothetical protein